MLYVKCALFFSRRGQNADDVTARHFYRICMAVDLPATARREIVKELFSAPARPQKPPPLPNFADGLVCLSLLMDLLVIGDTNLTPDSKRYLSQLAEQLQTLQSGSGTDLMVMLKQIFTSDAAGQVLETVFDVANIMGDGKFKRSLQVTGVAGLGIRARILSAASSQPGTEALRYDVEEIRFFLGEQMRRAIDRQFGSVSGEEDTQKLVAKLKELQARYNKSLRDDLAYFRMKPGFEFWPSATRRRLITLSVIESLLASTQSLLR
jgi:hypothetical protein